MASITPHGFGHATRIIEVLSAFRRAYPSIGVTVVSDLPRWLMELLPGVEQRRLRLDVGIVQVDAVRMNLSATLYQPENLAKNWNTLVDSEAAWLRAQGARLVICDIPALPFESASYLPLADLCDGNLGPTMEKLAALDLSPKSLLKVDGAPLIAGLLHQYMTSLP